MKLVFLQSNSKDLNAVQNVIPLALIPFVGKPLIQRQLELAAEQGVTDCTLFCYHGVEKIRKFCGNGERFGLNLQLFCSMPNENEIETLLKFKYLFSSPFILALGSVFARLPIKHYYDEHIEKKRTLTIIEGENKSRPFACIVSPGAQKIFKNKRSVEQVAKKARKEKSSDIECVIFEGHQAACQSPGDILKLNESTLEVPDFRAYTTFTEDTSGVFLGHHVRIHPSAQLKPPVAIGDFCSVSKDTVIGPNVTVGTESIIGRGSKLKNSIICESTYVGDMVSVSDSLVAGPHMVNLKTGAKVTVSDSFLLDDLSGCNIENVVSSVLNKSIALGLLVGLAPLGLSMVALAKIRSNQAVKTSDCLGFGKIAEDDDLTQLPRFKKLTLGDSSLPLKWYPRLLNVIRGQMKLVGPDAVSAENDNLVENYYKKRFETAPGLVGLRAIFESDEEAAKIAEVLYTQNKSIINDLRILIAYAVSPILGKKEAIKIARL